MPLDLKHVLQRALDVVRPLFEAAQHELRIELAEAELWMVGDSVRLEQVFTNLLSNAVKYSKKRGTICLRAQQKEGAIVITVSDTGTGISAALLPHGFDLFTQEERSIARSGTLFPAMQNLSITTICSRCWRNMIAAARPNSGAFTSVTH